MQFWLKLSKMSTSLVQHQNQQNDVRPLNAASNLENNGSLNKTSTQQSTSLAEPRPEDVKINEQLLQALESHKVFETEEELNHRLEIISKLNTLFKQWIIGISLERKMSKEKANKLGGKVYIFGSYALDVHDRESDIDVLCVAPRNIHRADYFSKFLPLLQKQPEVTGCYAIEETHVPLIKMNFDGIEIDLVFAKLRLEVIPDDLDLRDNILLKSLDEYSARSINGYRVTEEIRSLVPNLDNFRIAVRSIKLWAKQHGIYSSVLGYFGGISWTILVVKTCQVYPNATASILVNNFFSLLTRWKLPKPAFIKPLKTIKKECPVWYSDSCDLMPILTPAYPYQNCSHSVTKWTKKVMLMEFSRGLITTDEIMLGKTSWDQFFKAPSFFNRYSHFVVVKAQSKTADDHLIWCGLIQSKLRKLVQTIGETEHISMAHINPKCFSFRKPVNGNISFLTNHPSPYCSLWLIGLECPSCLDLDSTLAWKILDFTRYIIRRGKNIHIYKYGMYLTGLFIEHSKLSQYLDDEVLL